MSFLPPPSRVRVRYAETDQMGVVYYANYLVWFEVSRTDWLRHAGWSYRDMWWVSHNEHGAYAARGIHGQTIYIDPKAEMVIARFASHPVAANAALDPTSLPAYAALAEHLMN